MWCHEYSACDVINNKDCYHKVWIWCPVQCIWWHTYATCDVLYTSCDVFHRAGVMTYTVDVIVGRMCIRSDIELVLSYTQCLWHHREWIWCYKHSECHDIQTMVWCHQEWMWHHIQCLWCSTCSGCDLIYTQAVISSIKWVWLHRYSRCAVGYSGYVVIQGQCEMSYILSMMS